VLVVVTAVVAGVALVPAIAAAAASDPLVRAPQLSATPPPSGSVRLGVVPSNTPMAVDVVLRPSHAAELADLERAVQNPASPLYHHWLRPTTFTALFGPSPTAVAQVDAWLSSVGLVGGRPRGLTLQVRAPATAFESAFGLQLQRFRTPVGRVVFSADRSPLIGQGSAESVAGIVGLDDVISPASMVAADLGHESRVSPPAAPASTTAAQVSLPLDTVPTPCVTASSAAASSGAFTADAMGAAYGVSSLITEGLSGAGRTAAVFELAPHSANVASYENCFGLGNPISTVIVDTTGGTPSAVGTVEADLDLEQLATQAPGVSLLSYEGPDTDQGFFDTWNAIVQDDRASVVSTSWAYCEPDANGIRDMTTGVTLLTILDDLFQQAALQGQTILAGSGDSGSEGCFPDTMGPNAASTALNVTYPASDPFVTSVGGTTLTAGRSEVVWNTCQLAVGSGCASGTGGSPGGASGGGISRYFAKPSWQEGADPWVWSSAGNPCGQDCRGVPDISANAGVGVVFYVLLPGLATPTWVPIGGTSVSAPLVAGLVADISGSCASGALGDLAPSLYAYAGRGVYGLALRDITQGDNDLTRTWGGNEFAAGVGYDLATGWGSPIATGLACPQVTGVQPAEAPSGSQVTVTGQNLAAATVLFGSTPAHVVSAASTQLVVDVPAGAGSVVVSASTVGTGAATAPFSFGRGPAPRSGYWMIGNDGGVFAFGDAGFVGSLPGLGVHVNNIVGAVPTADGRGYWMIGRDGGVFAFGDAGYVGSLPGLGVHVTNVVGAVPTADGRGYWMIGSDGGVFAFGDAGFVGSLPGLGVHVNNIVGAVPTADGRGYWMIGRDGGVFAFGDAGFVGSLPGLGVHINNIVGAVPTADGRGYWMIGRDGGVFAFGDAGYVGSLPGLGVHINNIVGAVPTADGRGYWMVGSDGGVFAFGDAGFVGSLPGLGVAVHNVVGFVRS
jgi:subtilase family serine protease